MSLYNHPKEHRLRKPREGFRKSKAHLRSKLYGKGGHNKNPSLELKEKEISKKRNNKELILAFLIVIPLMVLANFFFLKKIVANPMYSFENQEQEEPYILPFDKTLESAYIAVANEDYQLAIYYFNYLKEIKSGRNLGIYGLISVYDDLCQKGNIYYCDELKDSLWLVTFPKDNSKKDALQRIRNWKGKMLRKYKLKRT